MSVRADSGAKFSPCRTWRYLLWRTWGDPDRRAMFVGLNPSTADETQDDPTVRRCLGFARAWGFGGLMMTNLFGLRSTDPRGLLAVDDPVGPGNDAAILAQARRCPLVVLAWGNHGRLDDRDQVLRRKLARVSGLRSTAGESDAPTARKRRS